VLEEELIVNGVNLLAMVHQELPSFGIPVFQHHFEPMIDLAYFEIHHDLLRCDLWNTKGRDKFFFGK
jgi:hypothetical protein